MLAWKVVGVALAVLCVCLLIYIGRMKRELRNIKNELELTTDKSYNRQVSVDLFDRDLSGMTVQLNKNLDYQKQLKLETEKAEKSIRQSVSDIAHDLRTPLTVIKGNLQMLRMEENLSSKGSQYVEMCVQKTDEMREMADDFFQLSVLESDLEAVELKRVDMTEQLLQFLVAQEAVIRTKGLEPKIVFPEKSIFVLADEKLLARIFGNLLNNVLRHAKGDTFQIILEEAVAPEAGKEPAAHAGGLEAARAKTTHTGGFEVAGAQECIITFVNEVNAPETLDAGALFERTYRGDKARRGNGAGLGLYIVKLLAQKQKARVKAKIKENMLYLSVIYKVYK